MSLVTKLEEAPAMAAWHFVNDTLRDGSPIPEDGEWLVYDGEIEPCASGYHASERVIDALYYAPGNTLCRVELDGEIKRGSDKLVAEKRKIIWRIDAESILWEASRKFALEVIHLWDAPDEVRQFLETGDESLRDEVMAAAWAAAWVRDGAGDAAMAAAMAATRAADSTAWARAAAVAARAVWARAAGARDAAAAATRAAAAAEARKGQEEILLGLLKDAGCEI